MRRIISAREQERKRKRNVAVMGVVLLLLMVLSTAGYAFLSSSRFGSSSSGTTQAGIGEGQVVQSGGRYAANFNGNILYFLYSPESTSEVPVETSATIQSFLGAVIYIDSENEAVKQELIINLERYASRIQEACYGECERDLPEKQCSDNVLVWRDSSENRVYQEEKCVFIEGDLRAVDAFLYKVFGYR